MEQFNGNVHAPVECWVVGTLVSRADGNGLKLVGPVLKAQKNRADPSAWFHEFEIIPFSALQNCHMGEHNLTLR